MERAKEKRTLPTEPLNRRRIYADAWEYREFQKGMPMDLTTDWRGRVLVASLRGELDMKHHEPLAAALDELAQADTTGLVLNFADVIYLASIGIGMLLKLVQRGRERGIPVRLASPRPAVRMVLEMVRAESSLPMDATVEEAILHMTPVAA